MDDVPEKYEKNISINGLSFRVTAFQIGVVSLIVLVSMWFAAVVGYDQAMQDVDDQLDSRNKNLSDWDVQYIEANTPPTAQDFCTWLGYNTGHTTGVTGDQDYLFTLHCTFNGSRWVSYKYPNDLVTDNVDSVELPDAEQFCKDNGFDWGIYGGPKRIQTDMLSITCHPEIRDSYTTYYFNLNMEVTDTEKVIRK